MKRLLYLGANVDIDPIIKNPDIKEFVYVDQLPRDYEAHWGMEYYKGLYLPKYFYKEGFMKLLIKTMKKNFTNVKQKLEGNKLTITFDKDKKLTYWLNTLLPSFNEKTQFQKIKKDADGLEKIKYFSHTNLTKEIVDDMLKCNVLYIMGYTPSFPILEMLRLNKIITYSYIMKYYKIKDVIWNGKKYGEIDLRKKFLGYNPPKEIEIAMPIEKNYFTSH